MSVFEKKGSPYFHFDFQFKGQRHHGSTGCTTRRAAEDFERRERQRAALPSQSRPPITLDEACGLYREHAEHLPSWPTIKYLLAALVKGLGANRVLSGISQRDLQVYFARRRAGRSNASVNREIENARSVWRHAAGARYDVGEIPEWKRLFLKVSKSPPRELAAATEETALFDALSGDAFDVVAFALESGWRRAEVIGLRWADCNLPRLEATTRIKGGDTVVRPLTASLVTIIANQPKVGPFVFTYVCRKSRGKRRAGQRYPMTATALRTRFDEARETAELEGFRFHDLRHTAATRIVRETGSLAAAKEALKHSHINTTLRYAHVLADDVRKALDAAKSRTIPEQRRARQSKA
jgi:integrase